MMTSLIQKLVLVALLIGYFQYIVTGDSINLNSDHDHIYLITERCPGSCNKKYCKLVTACRPVNRTSKLKHLDIYFNKGVKLEAPLNLEVITYKKFRTEYRPHMLKYKTEYCNMIKSQNHFISEFFGINKSRGNLFENCPLSGHRYDPPTYTSTWVGTLVPTGEWRVDFILSKIVDGIEEQILIYQLFVLVKAKDAIGADEF